MTSSNILPMVMEDQEMMPGDSLVDMPVTSTHRRSSSPGLDHRMSGRSTRSIESGVTVNSEASTPGAYSVQQRAVGARPAWRDRISRRFGGGQSRREQRQRSRRHRQESRNNVSGGQSRLPPEMTSDTTSRFSQMFRSTRGGATAQSSRSRFRMFSVRLFGGDADVQPQEQADLPSHDDLDENTYKKALLALLCVSIVAVAVAIAIVFALGDDGGEGPAPAPSPGPGGGGPSIEPPPGETDRLVNIREVLFDIAGEDSTALLDPATPQYEALAWLAERDQAGIEETDVERLRARYALATLFYATNGVRWTDRLEFLSSSHECDWSPDPVQPFRRGVSCNGEREIVSILLDGINLDGSIPFELTALSNLQYLTITNNTIEEGESERSSLRATSSLANIGFLSNLISLDLSRNLLDETIPESFARMSNLEILRLNDNRLKFTIPSEFSLLANLKELSLNNNRLVGAPENTLEALPNLEIAQFNSNDLLFSPDLKLPATLTELALSGNSITSSPLTSNIGRLSNLRTLNLVSTGAAGTLPTEVGLMTALEHLLLGGNRLSGDFPWSFLDGNSLIDLFLVQCNFSGQLPSDIGRFTALTSMGLIRNSFDGPIPESLGDLSSLVAFSVKDNSLTGTIPTSVGGMTSLFQFDVSNNQLQGTVPSEMSNMESLVFLQLAGNDMSGGDVDFVCSQPENNAAVDCGQNIICSCCGCNE